MELKPDKIINGRYRIVRLLDEGVTGSVFLAYDSILYHEVTIKIDECLDRQKADQFQHDALLLARLRHANLPKVIDYFNDGDRYCLVMEYAPGDNLRVVLDQESRLGLASVLSWANQLGSALSYLHKQKPPVVHGDINLSNIILTSKNHVLLTNFGIFRTQGNSQIETSQTASGLPDSGNDILYNPQADQYALAAVIYTLLTNQTFPDPSTHLINKTGGPTLFANKPDIPKYIQATLEKALSPNLQDRYTSVDDFILHLNHGRSEMTAGDFAMLNKKTAEKNGGTFSWLWQVFIPGGLLVALLIAGLLIARLSQNHNPNATNDQLTTPGMLNPEADNQAVVSPPPSNQSLLETSTGSLSSGLPVVMPSLEAAGFLGNGKMVAFISDRGDGHTRQIWTMKIKINDNAITAGDFLQRTFDDSPKQDPAWSPDGNWLLYSAHGSAGAGLDLWKLDINHSSSSPVRLTDMQGDDFQPSWSPDGQEIAFTHLDNPDAANRVYLMAQDGSQPHALSTVNNENYPVWLPESNWLLIVVNAANHRFFHFYDLEYLNKIQSPTPYPTPAPFDTKEVIGRFGDVSDPAVSKDGHFLAYTRTEGLTRRIYRADFSDRGAGAFLLTEGIFKESDPTWSPEADWICFTSERDNNQEIYIMTSTGQLSTNLSRSPGIDRQPAWQP